jgi:transglutaminase superfamily protein
VLPVCVAGIQLLALKALPYSTSVFVRASATDAEALDPHDAFSVGSIHWPVREYALEPKLQPLRDYYQTYCAGQVGLAAVTCLADRFARAFPFGEPPEDMFSADYDPVIALKRHAIDGEPGHCVTRAGLASAILLSAGIPSKVVQLVGPRLGHTIMSVWDDRLGWVMFDPTYDGAFTDGAHFLSSRRAHREPASVRWVPLGTSAVGADALPGLYRDPGRSPFSENLLYPEPWLYLRTGAHVAEWPIRGVFARVGPWRWWLGTAQAILWGGILLSLMLASLRIVLDAEAALRTYSRAEPRPAEPSRVPA